jgi:hypothetical protein
MGEYTAILKGYVLLVVFSDQSISTKEFGMDGLRDLDTEVALLLDDLDNVQSFTVTKVWSKPGETVSIPVKYQS